jgi:hypothetical protein
MTSPFRRLAQLLWAALAVVGTGLSMLVVTAWVVFLTTDRTTLVDGYWARREPWTSLGVALGVAGSTAAVPLGLMGTVWRRDLVRTLLMVPPIGLVVAWWLAALGAVPFPGFIGPDPIGFAYERPIVGAVALVLPAVAAAVLALSADPDRPARVRMRPVHPERPNNSSPPTRD